jgi:hypothetical protein
MDYLQKIKSELQKEVERRAAWYILEQQLKYKCIVYRG